MTEKIIYKAYGVEWGELTLIGEYDTREEAVKAGQLAVDCCEFDSYRISRKEIQVINNQQINQKRVATLPVYHLHQMPTVRNSNDYLISSLKMI